MLVGRTTSLSLFRELGPVITGLMLAARTGAKNASELGSMQVSEQIDALRAFGTNPVEKLAAPRLVAALVMFLPLTLVADLVGLVGGMLVSDLWLNVDMSYFWQSAITDLKVKDLIVGFAKPVVFSFFISTISCYYGLNTTGGTIGRREVRGQRRRRLVGRRPLQRLHLHQGDLVGALMIRLENVSIEFEGRRILENVSFAVPTGHTKVVLGPSGAGKSSLLKIILGLWKPDSGSVWVDDTDITHLSEREQMPVRRRLSMIFQGNALFDSLTVEENVGFFLEEHSELGPDEIRARVNACLDFVNLPGTNRLLPEELSGGMKKRVAIARAIAFDPEAILYDEPTTGLDPINAKTVTELVMKLKKERRVTSVVVTHILRDAFAVGDSLALMDGGRIVFDGAPKDLLACPDPFVQEFLSEIREEASLILNN